MRPKTLLVANILTHYRLPLYEELQKLLELEILFYSDGGEWYWQNNEQPSGESLRSVRWLPGVWVGRTRLVPALIPALLHADFDVVIKDPNGKFALPITYLMARLRRKPFVFWASMWEHPRTGVHRFTRPVMRYIYRRSDAVVTYGKHVSQFVIAEGANPSKVLVAPQAVRSDLGPAPTIDRWSLPRQFLYVGRLEPWKGPDVLLRALASLTDRCWQLKLVGDGSQAGELENLALSLGIAENVDFVGRLPNHELADIYRSSAAVIVPSVRTEQVTEVWSLVVNEAMQAGALVVASDAVGAAADGLVTDRVTGLVFRSGDIDGLASYMGELLAPQTDCAEILTMAKAGQKRVERYSHATAAQAFATAARQAVASQSKSRRWPRRPGGGRQ